MKKLTLPKLKAKLQTVFNKYIRTRDSGGGFFTCISCSLTKTTDEMNAGHFFAVKGYDGLRFDEENVHGECAGCNCWNESHLIGYQDNLKKKIGTKNLNALKKRAEEYKMGYHKWQRVDLEEKIEYYKQRIKEVQ